MKQKLLKTITNRITFISYWENPKVYTAPMKTKIDLNKEQLKYLQELIKKDIEETK